MVLWGPDVPSGSFAAARAMVVLTQRQGWARGEQQRGEHDAAITGLPYRPGVSCIVAEKARQPHGGLK